MQIHNLPERSAIADADVYAVDTGTTTGKTPFSLIKSLIKTFTLQFSDLTLKTTASNNDVFAIDDGTGSKKMRFSELKNQVVEKATPGYNSGDSETVDATSWTDVAKVTSGLTFTSTLNRITTMMKNVRYLFNLLGTTDISGSGKSTVTAAIGGNDISAISSDGTVTGALSALNSSVIGIITSADRDYFTPAVGQAYSGYDNCFFVRKGNLCWLHIGVRNVPTSGRQTLLATVPNKYKPLVSVKAVGTGGSGYDVYVWAAIDSSSIGVHTSDGYAQIDCVYFAVNEA